jgi:hypothetical protein
MGSGATPADKADPGGSLAERFRAALLARVTGPGVLEELPTQLAAVAAEVLGIDGVGVSAYDDTFRVPLGASDITAVAAERLQFTVGEGPCIQALHVQAEVRASADDIQRRWPIFYSELVRETPYLSIVSLPLQITPTIPGAVDLYFEHPTGAFTVDLNTATEVVGYIAEALQATATATEPSTRTPNLLLPAWMYSTSAAGRLRTWIAAGILMGHQKLNAPDALDRLRAYAYAQQQNLTDITDALINGELRIDELNL